MKTNTCGGAHSNVSRGEAAYHHLYGESSNEGYRFQYNILRSLKRALNTEKKQEGDQMKKKMGRYILIGGNYAPTSAGRGGFTAIRVVDSTDDIAQCKGMVDKHYDECGGLVLLLDRKTGEEVILLT